MSHDYATGIENFLDRCQNLLLGPIPESCQFLIVRGNFLLNLHLPHICNIIAHDDLVQVQPIPPPTLFLNHQSSSHVKHSTLTIKLHTKPTFNNPKHQIFFFFFFFSSSFFVVGYFGRRMTTTFIDAHRKATTHKSPHKASDILLVAENVYVRESSPSGEPIATETDFIRACEK